MAGTRSLGWSISRSRMLASCPRRYWLHYYGPRQSAIPARRERLFRLKGLNTVPTMAGLIGHRLIDQHLERVIAGRNGAAPSLHDEVTTWMRNACRTSWGLAGKELTRQNLDDPNRFLLLEHYYQRQAADPDPSQAIRERRDLLVERLERFCRSELVTVRLPRFREHVLPLPKDRFLTFTWRGIMVRGKADFAVGMPAAPEIYDWKTGAPSASTAMQLATYVKWAEATWGAAPQRTRVCAVELSRPEAEWRPAPVAPEQLDAWEETVQTTHLRMRELLVDGDAERNVALPEEEFPPTPHPQKCRRCAFRCECGDGQAALASRVGSTTLSADPDYDDEG